MGTVTAVATSASATATASPSAGVVTSCSTKDSDGFCLDGFGTPSAGSGSGISKIGNTNQNFVEIDASLTDSYKYTMVLNNKMSSSQTFAFWDMNGNAGPNSGPFEDAKLTVTVGAGQSTVVAFAEDTQGAHCPWNNERTSDGAFLCTWCEFNFADSSTGWSAADISSIQSMLAGKGYMSQVSVCDENGTCSSTTENSYNSASQPDGLGINLPAGQVKLTYEITG